MAVRVGASGRASRGERLAGGADGALAAEVVRGGRGLFGGGGLVGRLPYATIVAAVMPRRATVASAFVYRGISDLEGLNAGERAAAAKTDVHVVVVAAGAPDHLHAPAVVADVVAPSRICEAPGVALLDPRRL